MTSLVSAGRIPKNNDRIRNLLTLSFSILMGSRLCLSQSEYRVVGDNYEVVMHRAFCGANSAARLGNGCRIHYSYRFSGRTVVYISELGTAPAVGEFEYVTKEPRVTFQASPDGDMLGFVKVFETPLTRGDVIPMFPAYRDFPIVPTVNGQLRQNTIFSARAQTVLSDLFRAGYDPDEIRGGIRYFITAFRPLKSPHPNLSVEVSVMVSNPDPVAETKGFRIRWIGREKNRLEDDWHSPTPGSPSAVSIVEFIQQLRNTFEQ